MYTEPVAPQPFVQPFSSSASTESPYPDPGAFADDIHSQEEQAPVDDAHSQGEQAPPLPPNLPSPFTVTTQTQNSTTPHSRPSSPSSASNSSESSATSYGSWTADEAAEANNLMAVYEAREFGNEAEVDDWLYRDVEMRDAEGEGNVD
ncbi:hypothetical protein M407DRAFT_21025 [Tulasnella calospora MUT 4182]|uniref:Uncharacterized protein n=1 Tax=Tulasnella calospora MUT 4182 TaxID=1051891 RepID=A0A0C3M7W7_9AGAM|nr:hypothetical protein M407DRAFT_34263 [Tulasnella calospora MUT 4182]KIO29772.1 hypothetical protein M407DRAFT_21025 [Tulasnella calospora MUT 4182]